MPEMFITGRGRWVVWLSALSTLLTVTHSIEDFQENVAARFGLHILVAAFLLAFGYAVQIWATALVARDIRLGYWISLTIALIWVFAALTEHLGEILFADPYRSGIASKALEVGVILVSTLWAIASARMLTPLGREESAPQEETDSRLWRAERQ